MKALVIGITFFAMTFVTSRTLAESVPSALPGTSMYHLKSSWLNQQGRQQTFTDFVGTPRLLVMIYTKCEASCPLLVKHAQSLVATLPDRSRRMIKVDLFSFDSETESAKSMKAFALRYKIDEQNWTMHASSTNSVAELAAALGVQYKRLPSGEFIHANTIFLVDARGTVIAKNVEMKKSDLVFMKALTDVTRGP